MKDLETYLKDCLAEEGITDFRIATQIDGDNIVFYIHPFDRDGETLDFNVVGSWAENGEADPNQEFRQQLEELETECRSAAYRAGIKFYPAEEKISMAGLIQKVRHVLASLEAQKNDFSQTSYQLEREGEYLRAELLRHEPILGIESSKNDDITSLISRSRNCLEAYKKRLSLIEEAIYPIQQDLRLISECENRLTVGDWKSSVYGMVQVLVVRLCGINADRLRRINFTSVGNQINDEF